MNCPHCHGENVEWCEVCQKWCCNSCELHFELEAEPVTCAWCDEELNPDEIYFSKELGLTICKYCHSAQLREED